ncbi:MAG TPA: DUF2798 domain-containing protein [Hyphomicrobiales bacterium]|nr:DUF2798 domain-containing protein [Hyphomicrobiales bacterium]
MRQRGTIRIFRSEWHPAGCPRFQPEWEPVADPYWNEAAAARRLKLRRIPRRYTSYVMSVTVSMAMSAVITLFVAIRNYGITLETLLLWATAWPVSCVIAVPTRFAVMPIVKKITSALVEPPLR